MPFALGVGLALCIAIYSVIQVAVLNTPGAGGSARPLAVVASTLFGPWGAVLTNIGALVCIYGYLVLVTRVHQREAIALAATGILASLNWWWISRRQPEKGEIQSAVTRT